MPRNDASVVIEPAPVQPQSFGIGQLFWNIHEAVVVANASTGRIALWNPAAEAIFGYSAEEARDKNVEMLVPVHLKARHLAGLGHYNATGKGRIIASRQAIELPAVRKDGEQIYIELSLSPVREPHPPGRYVLAVIRDVTDRRQADDERFQLVREQAGRKESDSALHRLALLARAGELLAASLDYETTLDSVARLVVPNLADWCLVDVVGPHGDMQRVAAVHAGSDATHVERLEGEYPFDPSLQNMPFGVREVMRSGQPLVLPEFPDSLLVELALDESHLERLRAMKLRSALIVPMVARGRTLGAITLICMSGEKPYGAAEQSLACQLGSLAALSVDNARLYREAREAIQVRDEFLASASHDLRTPVTTIKAYAQVLQRRASRLESQEAAQLLEGLENIDDSASRLAVYISQLLDLSRLQAGRQLELDCHPTDLVGLARQAAAAHRHLSGRHRIRVKAGEPELIGNWDGARLERLLGNLLSNAVKFSPAGGEVTIRVDREEVGGTSIAVLAVSDQGIGIPAADLPRIYERFYRGRNLGERIYGSGIGLASVKEIIRRHGGTIAVGTQEEQGTTFTARLPLSGPGEPPFRPD